MTGDVRSFFDAINVALPARGARNVMVRCFANAEAHAHGDKAKSCSVSVETGAWNCKACGARGGPYDAAVSQGVQPADAMDLLRRHGLLEDDEGEKKKGGRPKLQALEGGKAKGRKRKAKAEPEAEGEAPPEPQPGGMFRLEMADVEAYQRALVPEFAERVAELRGWTPEAMERLELGSDTDWSGKPRVTMPLYDEGGALVGLLRYQPDPKMRRSSEHPNLPPKMLAEDHSERQLFPAPERFKVEEDDFVFLVEGEPDAVACWSVGIAAVAVPGVEGWDEKWARRFRDKKVVVCFDCDDAGRRVSGQIAKQLQRAGVSVRRLDLDRDRDDGYDLTDWLAKARTPEERASAKSLTEDMARSVAPVDASATGAAKRLSLNDVFEVYDRWLQFPDATPLLAVLGGYAANHLQGEPVWLFLLGPPGSGKTELLMPLTGLPDVHLVSTLASEASLLSGTSAKDRAKDATGGLLREIGDFGVVLFKDFTSVLSMHRDRRQGILAAFREAYDGSWTREIGAEGGRKLRWEGKMGWVGGVTYKIERMHESMSGLGERFIYFRMPRAKNVGRLLSFAQDRQGDDVQMRRELKEAVLGLFADGLPREPLQIDQEDKLFLQALSTLVAYGRSPVERDGYSREVELIVPAEVPVRLLKSLGQLMAGITALGADRARARAVAGKIGLDSIPSDRLAVLEVLWSADGDFETADGNLTTTQVSERTRLPTVTARRTLEDLWHHDLLERTSQGQGKADLWRLLDPAWTLMGYVSTGTVDVPAIQAVLGTFPEPSTPPGLLNDEKRSELRELKKSLSKVDDSVTVGKTGMAKRKPDLSRVSDSGAADGNGAGPTNGEVIEQAEEWVRSEGFLLDDVEIEAELGRRSVGDAEVVRLIDVAYDARRGPAA